MEFYLTIKRNKALINFEAKPQKHAEQKHKVKHKRVPNDETLGKMSNL